VDQSTPNFFSNNVVGVVDDDQLLWFLICWSFPEIFAIKVESCQKLRKKISAIFCRHKFLGAGIVKIVPILSPLPRGTSTITQGVDNRKYNYVENDEVPYLLNRDYAVDATSMHGPAVFTVYGEPWRLPSDSVNCVRCLSWPPLAIDWPTRHRMYCWPDSATLGRVVRNGCDVVGVAHRQCRQHEWMGKLQWRLSFSRAEIVLINIWIPVQHIVYHTLRYFVKTERLTDYGENSGAGTLSNIIITGWTVVQALC